MTLAEATTIVQIWGRHLEYSSGKLLLIFASNIPESFLPFPKKVLEEAFAIVAEHLNSNGNDAAAKLMQNSISLLRGYIDDEQAVLRAAELFNDPQWRQIMLPVFKKAHKDWIKTQGVSNLDI